MKKSEQLRKEAEREDNDLVAIGIYNKVLREERSERFENYIDKLLKVGFDVTEVEKQGKFTIEPTDFGTVDYYPKANKVLIRKDNEWIKGGLRWIIKNLLSNN